MQIIFQKECTIRGKPDEPVAVQTELGWVLSGPMKGESSTGGAQSVQVNFVGSSTNDKVSLDKEVQKLWELETLGIQRVEDEVYKEFKNSISFQEGRYSVKLPWKTGHPELPNNYVVSLHRLKTQVARLEREPEVLREYASIIEEQLKTGVIEKVVELEKAVKVHYLPHQAVVRKEAATTKVRIVYDASSKGEKTGTSLNDCLHVGPSLKPLLYDILPQFRENRIVLMGDIEKAFLNIGTDKEDRDSVLFLWLKDPPDLSRVVVYRFCRVVFGLNASPFLLSATLRHHITKFMDDDPDFVSKLLESFYVADFVGGGASSEEVTDLCSKTSRRMLDGGFKLRKWMTNDASVRCKIESDSSNVETEHDVAGEYVNNDTTVTKMTKSADSNTEVTHKEVSEEDTSCAKSCVGMQLGCKGQKVLGLAWDYEEDMISLDLSAIARHAQGLPATKRNTLRLIAGIFDPLGIIGPVTITAKILFQEACRQKIRWDDPLKDKVKQDVETWIEGLL